jgi:hypothetical protein
MLSKGMEIELSNSDAGNAMQKGEYWLRVVELVIGGVPTVLEIHFMCLFISLGRILLQGSVSTNPVDPERFPVDLLEAEVEM